VARPRLGQGGLFRPRRQICRFYLSGQGHRAIAGPVVDLVMRVRWRMAPAQEQWAASWGWVSVGRSLTLPAQYAAFPVALLAVWQACVQIGFVRRNVLPAPTDVAFVWYDLITGATDAAARYSGTWFDHAAASIWRVTAGFTWGVALGILVGLLIGLSRVIERVLDPTIQVLRNIPVTAWVPLSLVFFGIG